MNLKKIFSVLVVLYFGISFVSAEVSKPRTLIPVPAKFKNCKVDSDCQLVGTLCGCCDYDVINSSKVEAYTKMEKQCKVVPPPCDCPKSDKTFKCVAQMCKVTN